MLAQRMARVTASAIMELIKTTAAGNYISFASGLPDPTLYPVELISELTREVLETDGKAALQYGAAEGYAPLREFVSGMLRRRGLDATPEHVLITTGSQQALDLAARALLDPGDRVLLESPSYLAAIQAFDSYEAVYGTVPLDGDGMQTTELDAALAAPTKLIYTLPNFQNPTGITLTGPRRHQLAETAAARGVAVLEDDAYHDLRYEGSALPPVCALAANPWAIYTGTLSKTMAPGLRVGYLWAQPELVVRLGHLKQIKDLHTGSLTQRVAHLYCTRGHLEPGIAHLCETYRRRRDVMLEELERHLAGVVEWTHPEGGMFLFVTCPEGKDTTELLPLALARGIVFVPGGSFHPDGRGKNTLRLNFVSAGETRIREGIAILAGVLREWLG